MDNYYGLCSILDKFSLFLEVCQLEMVFKLHVVPIFTENGNKKETFLLYLVEE